MSTHSIHDTVTEQDVGIVAQTFTNDKTVKILNYCLANYSADKLGFLGAHSSLKITLQVNTIFILIFLLRSSFHSFFQIVSTRGGQHVF